MAETVHSESPNKEILDGLNSMEDVTLSRSLTATINPFNSLLGVVIPPAGVTLHFAVINDTCHVSGPVGYLTWTVPEYA